MSPLSRRLIPVIAVVLAACSILFVVPVAQARPAGLPKGVNVSVSVGKKSLPVPGNYVGVSIEMSGICNLLQMYNDDPARLESLLKDLGSVVLKVAGKSSDYATWAPTGVAVCSEKGTVLTESEVSTFFTLAKSVGARVIWGLPFINYNPAAAAAQAKYVYSVGKPQLLAWAIGNEPDIYIGAGMRPKTWNIAQMLTQWKATVTAVKKVSPKIPVSGPDVCCNDKFFDGFAKGSKGYANDLSFHAYAASVTNLTAARLMEPATLAFNLKRIATRWKSDSQGAKVPLWLTEVNTFPQGGVPGVSDAYASALWLSDFMLSAANNHLSQADVQFVDGTSAYDPITLGAEPAPIFYGQLFYHSCVPAGTFYTSKQVVGSSSINVTSYLIHGTKGQLVAVLFNKGGTAETALVTGDKTYKSAGYYQMQSPALDSSTVTIGGQSIATDGTVTAPKATTVKLSKNAATIKLPPYSGTCLTFSAH